MSAVPGGFLDLSPFAGDRAPYRVIDPDGYKIIAQVTLSEDGEDQLMITEHPVEQGAAISDHSYKRPAEFRVQLGWSQSGGWSRSPGLVAAVTNVQMIYERILGLQAQRYPFPVYSGKRHYDSMLVADVRYHNDEKLETSLVIDIVFRQINIVSIKLAPGAPPGAMTATPATAEKQQSNPPATLVSTSTGQKAPSTYLGTAGIAGLAGSPSGPSVTPPSQAGP